MKICGYCNGYGTVNEPIEKYTNGQGCSDCYRHKDARSCIWQFRFQLEKHWFKWFWACLWKEVCWRVKLYAATPKSKGNL